MAETIVVNMNEVVEKPMIEKGVYTFTFKDSKAFLVRSKKEGSDWIGLQGIIVPEGKPDDSFTLWLAVNHSMRDGLDAKKFLKGLGYSVEGASAVKLGGELSNPEQVKAGNGPQAMMSAEGKQPIPIGFLKFKGELGLETNKANGRQNARLLTVLGRVE